MFKFSSTLTGSALVAVLFLAGTTQAQNITLTHTAGSAGGASDIAGKHLAEIAAAGRPTQVGFDTRG